MIKYLFRMATSSAMRKVVWHYRLRNSSRSPFRQIKKNERLPVRLSPYMHVSGYGPRDSVSVDFWVHLLGYIASAFNAIDIREKLVLLSALWLQFRIL